MGEQDADVFRNKEVIKNKFEQVILCKSSQLLEPKDNFFDSVFLCDTKFV